MIGGWGAVLMVLLGGGAMTLPAQSGLRTSTGAALTLVGTQADPIPGGGALTEVRVVSPILTGAVERGDGTTVRLEGTLNLERWTIPNGQLALGTFGEGFIDRRHPHTTAHELIGSVQHRIGGTRMALVVGKGFVPFGTDDPMHRPFVAFPVNHHWAQLLERAVVIGQVRRGPLAVEAAWFNGDEPEHPGQWPLLRTEDGRWRFGDSRAGRLTWWPVSGLELQGSLARVLSPEHRPGAGGPSHKVSVSGRWQRNSAGGAAYLLTEWARTTELGGAFAFHTALIEGTLHRGPYGIAWRFESTERPEEERLENPFRTLRPHHGDALHGITRWSLHTMRVEKAWQGTSGSDLRPFVEVTLGRVRKVGGGVANPAFLYRGGTIRQISAGVRLALGHADHRMGRYGVLRDEVGYGQPMGHHAMLEPELFRAHPTEQRVYSDWRPDAVGAASLRPTGVP